MNNKLLPRSSYTTKLKEWLSVDDRVLFLQGARGSGKTQIMKTVHEELQEEGIHSYFYSFEENIFLQSFDSVSAFMEYRSLKRGISPNEEAVLFLDEVQYQPNLLSLLLEIRTHPGFVRKVIVSSHILPADVDRHQLHTLTVHPLSFYEYLTYLWFHIEYLHLDKYSKVIGHELRQKQQAFLTRGGFPSITCALGEQEKRRLREELLEKMIDKDIKFVFTGRDISDFEKTFLFILRNQPLPGKIGYFSKQLGIPRHRMSKFISFMIQYNILVELPVFAPNSRDYITNLPILIARDTGMVSVVSENFGEKRHMPSYLVCFVYNELIKTLSSTKRTIAYIKKKNGTTVDMFIYHQEKKKGYALLLRPKNNAFHPKVISSDSIPAERSVQRIGISQEYYQPTSDTDTYRIIPAYMIQSLAHEIAKEV